MIGLLDCLRKIEERQQLVEHVARQFNISVDEARAGLDEADAAAARRCDNVVHVNFRPDDKPDPEAA